MKMTWIAFVLVTLGGCAVNRDSELREVDDDRFMPGQVWTLKGDWDGLTPTATILRIEDNEKFGRVVHLRIDGIELPGPNEQPTRSISHMPLSKVAAQRSLSSSGKVSSTPAELDGYETWREAFDKGEAGVFTVTIKEAVDAMAETIRSNHASGN
ncbi:MAG: hypothetical protein AAF219_08580 [Myxococcota bacterium]